MATLIDNSSQKALTTLARMKVFLGIGSDKYDTLLTQLINQTTGFIEQYLKRNLLSQTYTDEEYDGTGTDTLVLKQFPVTTFTKMQVNNAGDNTSNWNTINASRYFAEEDGRVRLATSKGSFLSVDSGFFIDDKNKYRVTYIAGYLINFANENTPANHTLPMEIEYICQKLVSALFNTRKAEGVDMSKMGDLSVRMKKNVFEDKETRAILDKYAAPTI